MKDEPPIDILLVYVGGRDRGYEFMQMIKHSHSIATAQEKYTPSPINEANMIEIASLDSFVSDDKTLVEERVGSIFETRFEDDEAVYRVIEIMRGPGERRKFMHFFENIPAIIFPIWLTDYDQSLPEVSSMNYLQDCLALFNGARSSTLFTSTSILIVFIGRDEFEKRLETSPLNAWFPDYQGNTLDAAADFILHKFISAGSASNLEVQRLHFYTLNATTQEDGLFHFLKTALKDVQLNAKQLVSNPTATSF
ncbi:G-protein alpha subunit-domain-containing protein [Flagelloscypha sp. PMI_526]|nr:G-protein alpha subunit-domain-containing protein [Flagelloscypha sp. PMI_526]